MLMKLTFVAKHFVESTKDVNDIFPNFQVTWDVKLAFTANEQK